MKRKMIVTKQQIDALYDAGNIDALRSLNETYAKRANQRLATLEKNDMGTTSAYNRAVDWIQSEGEYTTGDRFTRSKKLDIDELRNQLIQETDFLRLETSTVSGELKRRDRIFKSMMNSKVLDLEAPEDSEEYKHYKEQFLKFLDEDVFNELVKVFKPTDIINAGSTAIQAGQDPEALNTAFKNYMAGQDDTDIFEIWDNWAKAPEGMA